MASIVFGLGKGYTVRDNYRTYYLTFVSDLLDKHYNDPSQAQKPGLLDSYHMTPFLYYSHFLLFPTSQSVHVCNP